MTTLLTATTVLLSTAVLLISGSRDLGSIFKPRYVRMCLKPEFTKELKIDGRITEITCASACTDLGSSCQGFQLIESGSTSSTVRCVAFVFDKCSHMVRTDCSQSAWAYVRNQAGLPDGQLCPDGFGSGYFGSNYKIVSVSSWTDGLSKCSSLPGLTKFADSIDRNETLHMHWIKATLNAGRSFFVGGWRPGGAFGNPWSWYTCNVTFLPELWMPGQPNGGVAYNRANIWTTHANGIDDETDVCASISQGLCECIDPF